MFELTAGKFWLLFSQGQSGIELDLAIANHDIRDFESFDVPIIFIMKLIRLPLVAKHQAGTPDYATVKSPDEGSHSR